MNKIFLILALSLCCFSEGANARHTISLEAGIKEYLPIDWSTPVSYTCDGTLIDDQLTVVARLSIYNYKSVKRVHVKFSGNADDSAVLTIGDKFRIDTVKDGIASFCEDFSIDKDYDITLTSEDVVIKSGARNMYTSQCYFNGNISLKFYFK